MPARGLDVHAVGAARVGGKRRRSCRSVGVRERVPLATSDGIAPRSKRAMPAPEAVLHEDPRPAVDRRRPVRRQRALVQRRRIAAVRFEAVGRENAPLRRPSARRASPSRPPMRRPPRARSGRPSRSCGRRAAWRGSRACRRARCDRARSPAPRAVPALAAQRGAALRSCRAGRIPSWTRMSRRRSHAPSRVPAERRLHARRASAASSLALRRDVRSPGTTCGDGHRPCPRSATDLVDPDDDTLAGLQHFRSVRSVGIRTGHARGS